MTSIYQQLLKQSYLNRLRNKKVVTGNDLLLQLDRISEDYQKEDVNRYDDFEAVIFD